MRLCLITCFYGRAEKVERILRIYLDQTYNGPIHLLLFNNAPYPQTLGDFELPDNKTIALVNNFLDLETGREYTNTGDIFRDALKFVPENTDVISFFDSDDVFLPIHAQEGVKGMEKAFKEMKMAYKPYYSYFLGGECISLAHNTLEPSIFVALDFVKRYGFYKTSSSYHQAWETKLKERNQILIDPEGTPTLLYDWSKGHNTFKISGSGDDGPENLRKHREFETDFGDGYLYPAPKEQLELQYNRIKELNEA